MRSRLSREGKTRLRWSRIFRYSIRSSIEQPAGQFDELTSELAINWNTPTRHQPRLFFFPGSDDQPGSDWSSDSSSTKNSKEGVLFSLESPVTNRQINVRVCGSSRVLVSLVAPRFKLDPPPRVAVEDATPFLLAKESISRRRSPRRARVKYAGYRDSRERVSVRNSSLQRKTRDVFAEISRGGHSITCGGLKASRGRSR